MSLFFFLFLVEGYRNVQPGRENRVATRRAGAPNSTMPETQTIKSEKVEESSLKSHTFRVDSCSKHLLAAPLIVQNVDA